jgi:hypothetical protein
MSTKARGRDRERESGMGTVGCAWKDQHAVDGPTGAGAEPVVVFHDVSLLDDITVVYGDTIEFWVRHWPCAVHALRHGGRGG